jgi:hypothetical protein
MKEYPMDTWQGKRLDYLVKPAGKSAGHPTKDGENWPLGEDHATAERKKPSLRKRGSRLERCQNGNWVRVLICHPDGKKKLKL